MGSQGPIFREYFGHTINSTRLMNIIDGIFKKVREDAEPQDFCDYPLISISCRGTGCSQIPWWRIMCYRASVWHQQDYQFNDNY